PRKWPSARPSACCATSRRALPPFGGRLCPPDAGASSRRCTGCPAPLVVDCPLAFLYGGRMRRACRALLVVAFCVACGHKKPALPSGQLWAEGNQAMQDEAWQLATERYKALLEQYPFDPNSEEAELKIAEAYFNSQRYAEAIAAYGDFERMHPTSDNLAEIEYRRGMAYLAQHRSSDRDQQSIKNALDSFHNIVDRYPGPRWAARAQLRVRECREEMAEHDADIATFYLHRGSLRAAESRLRGLLTDYPDTDATAQALD